MEPWLLVLVSVGVVAWGIFGTLLLARHGANLARSSFHDAPSGEEVRRFQALASLFEEVTATTGLLVLEGVRAGRRLRVALRGEWLELSAEVPGGLTWRADPGAEGAQAREAREAMASVRGLGLSEPQATNGWLQVRRRASIYALRPESVAPVLDALGQLAGVLARAPVEVRIGGAPRAGWAWSRADAVLLCPYCRDALGHDALAVCGSCGTAHHAECLAEAGRCTVFGCLAASPDDPPRGRVAQDA